MSENLFDKFVHDKLYHHASNVPNDIWERIENDLSKEKPASFIKHSGIVIIALLFIVATFCLMYFFLPPSSKLSSKNAEHTQVKNNGLENTQTNSSENNPDNTQYLPLLPSGNDKDTTVSIIAQDSRTTIGSMNMPVMPFRDEIIAIDTTVPVKDISEYESWKPVYSLESDIFTCFQKKLLDDSRPAWQVPMRQMTIAHQDEKLEQSRTVALKDSTGQFAANIPNLQNKKGNVPKNHYIEFFASPDYVWKQTSADPGYEEYLNKNKSLVTNRLSFTAGVRFSTDITNRLQLKSGFQYSQVNEVFDYKDESAVNISFVIRRYARPNMFPDIVDTSQLIQVGYREKKTYNKYYSFDLPVILNYSLIRNKNWQLGVSAGAICNLFAWSNGDLLNTNNQPVSFNEKDNNTFKRNIDIGLYTGVSIYKPVSRSLDLYAEPWFRHNLSNMVVDKKPFNQRFNTGGLSLGLRYNLNN